MQTLSNVTVGDEYTVAATIENVISGNGGYATISGNDVFCELEYGLHGQLTWTDEFHVPIGGIVIHPGTTGIRFRNFVAGSTAVITATIAERSEPAIDIAATGQAASGASNLKGVTGVISAAGGILAGSGFTAAHIAAGKYKITFTPTLSNAPVILATPLGATGYEDLTILNPQPSATDFSVGITNQSGGVFTDNIWWFLAVIIF